MLPKRARSSPQALAAQGTYNAYLRIKAFWKNYKLKTRGVEITINRKPYFYKRQPFKQIDMQNFGK